MTTRHEFLRGLHRVIRPRNYLEIGVSEGASLALSRVPSVGIDPALKVNRKLRRDAQLISDTSDAFFARPDPLRHLRPRPGRLGRLLGGRARSRAGRGDTNGAGDGRAVSLDFAFIDGMHLVEFALRDFMNVERHSRWSTVVVFDDMLPRNVDEAARDRHTGAWAGDVYKLIAILREHRPDLMVLPVNTSPTGVLVVLGADPANTVLHDRYAAIEAAAIVPDPQMIPASILERRDALDPQRLLAAPFWSRLVSARNRGADRREYDALRREVAAFASAPANLLPRSAEASRRSARRKRASLVRRTARRVIPVSVRAALVSPARRVVDAVRDLRG